MYYSKLVTFINSSFINIDLIDVNARTSLIGMYIDLMNMCIHLHIVWPRLYMYPELSIVKDRKDSFA